MASKKFRLWCRTDRGGGFYCRFPGGSWQSTNTTDRAVAETHVNDILNARRTARVLKQELPDDKAPAGAATLSLRGVCARLLLVGQVPALPEDPG